MTTPSPRHHRILVPLLLIAGLVSAAIGAALALTPTGTRDFAFIASSQDAIYSPISPFWLTWSHPIGLTLLALGAGTTGAALTLGTLARQYRHT